MNQLVLGLVFPASETSGWKNVGGFWFINHLEARKN